MKHKMIEKLLKNKTVKQKANIKSAAIAELDFVGQYVDATYGIRVEILSLEKIEGGIQIMARAWKGGNQLGFGKDGSVDIERFRIMNPPILVDDPNGDIFRKDREGNITRTLREDPIQAIKSSLAHTISITGQIGTDIIEGKVGHTVTDFFPAAGTNEPVDGYVFRAGVDETFSTIRAGAGTGAQPAIANIELRINGAVTSNQYREIDRAIVLFDTSAIDADSVDSAILSMWISTNGNGMSGNTHDNSRLVLVASTPDSTSNLITTDYGQLGSVNFGESDTQVNMTVGTYEVININGDADPSRTLGLAAINKTGITKYGIVYKWDFGNTTTGLTWVNDIPQNIVFKAADQAGTDNDVKLTVTHLGEADTGNMFAMFN